MWCRRRSASFGLVWHPKLSNSTDASFQDGASFRFGCCWWTIQTKPASVDLTRRRSLYTRKRHCSHPQIIPVVIGPYLYSEIRFVSPVLLPCSLLCCLTSIIGYPVAYVLPSLTGCFTWRTCMILCSHRNGCFIPRYDSVQTTWVSMKFSTWPLHL